MLPAWMQWVQAIAVLAIACLGAWIAYQQARIAAARLDFDLFEKRYAVFEGARDFLIKGLQSQEFETTEIIRFNVSTADAVFLFDEQVVDYLNRLRERVVRLKTLNDRIKTVKNEKIRNASIDSAEKMTLELGQEMPVMIENFRPYMRLGNTWGRKGARERLREVLAGISARVLRRRSQM
jgi:acyl transferase domain-containing protein